MSDNNYLICDIRIDGITPSKEFLEFAEKEKRGEVTEEEIKRLIILIDNIRKLVV